MSNGFICLISFQFSRLRQQRKNSILRLNFEYLAVNFSAFNNYIKDNSFDQVNTKQ